MTEAGRPSRSGARQRRRGLYGPPPRLSRTVPLTGRLLWHIGDWGRASEHIGGRWEAVGAELAQRQFGPTTPLLVLAATPPLMAEVLASGLPHADALRTWCLDGRLLIEPLDFKWSLETASARQVSTETLQRLLDTELPNLQAALLQARTSLGLEPAAELELRDGRFIAPEHPANRAALRAEPGLPSLLLPVEPHAFFEPLPGWAAARALARIEGADLDRLRSIDAIERYYRLGAGVTGALSRLRSNLFETNPAPIDAAAEIAALRQAGQAATLNGLLMALEGQLAQRRVLEEQLAQLPRTAYPFGRLRRDLQRLGVPPAVLGSRGALGRAYGDVSRAVAEAIREAGLELTATGLSQPAALAQLAATPERWARIGADQAQQVAARLAARL